MKVEKVFKGSQKVELCDLMECTSTSAHQCHCLYK